MEKTCTKCKKVLPATLEFFFKNAGGKFGLTPRCKTCVTEDNTLSHQKRLQSDPDHVRKLANARSKKHYQNNLDSSREVSRKSAAKARQDPEKYLKIQSRKRAGYARLTPDQIEQIRSEQKNLCAICDEPNPTDLDHSHESGEVRWLLCKHCNRGLGAFRDNPDWLEKAAQMLRKNYNQRGRHGQVADTRQGDEHE